MASFIGLDKDTAFFQRAPKSLPGVPQEEVVHRDVRNLLTPPPTHTDTFLNELFNVSDKVPVAATKRF